MSRNYSIFQKIKSFFQNHLHQSNPTFLPSALKTSQWSHWPHPKQSFQSKLSYQSQKIKHLRKPHVDHTKMFIRVQKLWLPSAINYSQLQFTKSSKRNYSHPVISKVFKNILFTYFERERKGGRKRGRETLISCPTHAPNQGPGLQLRQVP